MANNLKIAQRAKRDIKFIWTSAAEFNFEATEKLTTGFLRKFRLLAENPHIGYKYNKIAVNLKSFPHKKYIIFYFEIAGGVEIYRVLHGTRNIEDLFEDYFEGLKP